MYINLDQPQECRFLKMDIENGSHCHFSFLPKNHQKLPFASSQKHMRDFDSDFITLCTDQTDNYNYLIPVMKALIVKAYKLMLLDLNLPSLPSTSLSPTFFDDFKTYCKSEEWNKFIDSYVSKV